MTSVSIIIPTYNSSPFIKRTLGSIIHALPQGYSYEVLLIDDCSDDIAHLEQIASAFPCTRVIRKAKKTNAADSRNIGLQQSAGSYIFLLDSDDHYLPGAFEHRIQLHQQQHAGICFGAFLVDETAIELVTYQSGSMMDYLFLKKGDARTSTISICRDYYKNTIFDSRQNKHQDWGFLIRAEQNGESLYFDKTPISNIDESTNLGRMSAKLNLDASLYFIRQYKLSPNHLCMFIRRHIKLCIMSDDHASAHAFRKLLKDNFLSMAAKYKIKSLILYLCLSPVMRPIVKRLFTFKKA